MNKIVKIILLILDLAALLATFYWYITTREIAALAGLLVTAGTFFAIVFAKTKDEGEEQASNSQVVNLYTETGSERSDDSKKDNDEISMKELNDAKHKVRILFIDDDNKFKVIKILRNAGWVNTKLVKDVKNFTEEHILSAHIIFVDVRGVGKLMDFTDEGLGLAASIKEKLPKKKVVIYSAEPKGNRFHTALRKADDMLEKNAEPYEFESIIEQMTRKLIKDGEI